MGQGQRYPCQMWHLQRSVSQQRGKGERKKDVSGLTLPWTKGQLCFTGCISHKEYKQHRLGLGISGQEDGGSCLYSCFKGQFET